MGALWEMRSNMSPQRRVRSIRESKRRFLKRARRACKTKTKRVKALFAAASSE